MNRRQFLARSSVTLVGSAGMVLAGCRDVPTAEVMKEGQKDRVGTTAAGAETYKPMIEDAVGKMLARHTPNVQLTSTQQTLPPAKKICFVGLENKSSEELGDFKDHIIETIDERIINSKVFQTVSRKYVEVGLQQTHMRPEMLMMPANRRAFLAIMEEQGQPFEFLLFATLTSATTRGVGQKDYKLTLELVNITNGETDKESAEIRKVYGRSRW